MLQVFDPVEVLMSHTMEGRVLHTKVKNAAGTWWGASRGTVSPGCSGTSFVFCAATAGFQLSLIHRKYFDDTAGYHRLQELAATGMV